MPSNSKEYIKKNYYKYYGNPEAIHKRVIRNAARRIMIKKGLVKVGEPDKQIDHINGTQAGNGEGNLRVISALKNKQLGQKISNRIRTRIYNKK